MVKLKYRWIFLIISIGYSLCLWDYYFTKLLKFKESKKLQTNKYIVYECIEGMGLCGGWGDRLKGIYSAYAWSLVSGRRFYINIKKPCNLTSFLEPNSNKLGQY